MSVPTPLVVLGMFCTFLFTLALAVAFASAIGAVMMVIGNIILTSTNHTGYTTSKTAAYIGSIGGIFANLILGFFGLNQIDSGASFVNIIATIAVSCLGGTLSGVIGRAILVDRNVDLGGFGTVNAARAGALGGAVFGIPVLVLLSYVLKWVVQGYRKVKQRVSGVFGGNKQDKPELADVEEKGEQTLAADEKGEKEIDEKKDSEKEDTKV
ncbi:hypothetical protein CVT24_002597 [Panaeolus cyanescens]|uniref:Uncharacterized protein n=1 Tax=Panaeolus cyanescens TaxID=181874 RepID=A0A409WB42_9AGAR|nr:hypothetical protein CVT24_002597 [Panaeolus cyanescens]